VHGEHNHAFTSLNDGAADDLLRLCGSVSWEFLTAFNGVDNVHALADGTEDGVISIEPRRRHCGEEKLGATGVSAGVRHGKNARFVVLESQCGRFARDLPAWATGSCSARHGVFGVRTAALNHEIFNDTVKVETVVVAHVHQFHEVGYGVWCVSVKEVDGDVAGAGFHEDLHDMTIKRHLKRICLSCPEAHLDNETMQAHFMTHLLDVPFETMDGETTTLRDLGGSRWLVVNVASACGATPQYAGLQDLHEAHDDLTVVGFPCNQFGAQEPGSHAEICAFTSSKYNITFPLMAKIEVNGKSRATLFELLCSVADGDGYTGDIRWNFEKFLIDENGDVQRFSTRTQPDALLTS
jgi:glutathione peroxidase